jgi:hypothetical protein
VQHVAGRHRRDWSGRLGVVATGGALVGAAALVTIFDPASPGSRFPACTFHGLTGLWCPGCGLTRGVHHLLRGDVVGALGSNLFTPLAVLAIVAAWSTWARRAFRVPSAAPSRVALPRWAGALLVAAMVVYAVLRNLPMHPFVALAP